MSANSNSTSTNTNPEQVPRNNVRGSFANPTTGAFNSTTTASGRDDSLLKKSCEALVAERKARVKRMLEEAEALMKDDEAYRRRVEKLEADKRDLKIREREQKRTSDEALRISLFVERSLLGERARDLELERKILNMRIRKYKDNSKEFDRVMDALIDFLSNRRSMWHDVAVEIGKTFVTAFLFTLLGYFIAGSRTDKTSHPGNG